MKKILSYLSLSLFAVTTVKAQQQPIVDILNNTTSPLLNNYITDIKIDNSGNKWISTLGGGLAKYDGTNWTLYTSSNSLIPSNYISCIEVDPSGNVWVGTKNTQVVPSTGSGLAKFNGSTWTIYNTSTSNILANVISCLASDQSGNIYVGIGYNSPIGGISMFNGSTFTNYQSPDQGLVTAMDIDNNGKLWVKSNSSFYKFENGVRTNISTTGSNVYDVRGTIKVDHLNNVWASGILTSGAATLKKFDGTTWVDMSNSIMMNWNNNPYPIMDIAEDVGNNLWFAQTESNTSHLTKYDGETWNSYQYYYISSVAVENNGDIWLGDYDFGVKHIHHCAPIINQPTDQQVPLSSNASFNMGISGQGSTFIWKVDKGAGFGFENVQDGALYSGATTSTLTINNVQNFITDYRYKCLVDSGSLCNQMSNTVKVIIGTVGTKEVDNIHPEIALYPNPVKDRLSIKANIKVEKVEVTNVLGQSIPAEFANGSVDLSTYSKGLFFLKIDDKYVYKVVKE